MTSGLYFSLLLPRLKGNKPINFISHMNKLRRSIEHKKSPSSHRDYRTMTIDPKPTKLPEIRNVSSITARNKDFNKYYINPALRYKSKVCNPKEDP
jgi:hypothetical protein